MKFQFDWKSFGSISINSFKWNLFNYIGRLGEDSFFLAQTELLKISHTNRDYAWF